MRAYAIRQFKVVWLFLCPKWRELGEKTKRATSFLMNLSEILKIHKEVKKMTNKKRKNYYLPLNGKLIPVS